MEGESDNLEVEIAQLKHLSLVKLRALWRQRLHKVPPLVSTELTRRWLAWELQARERGGFDVATRRHLQVLAKSLKESPSKKRTLPVAVKPGTVMIRKWGGATYEVVAMEHGFLWRGNTYGSLTEIAIKITGGRWSGPKFFGLKRRSRL